MKKWFALALALVTMMMGSLALAEEVPAADPAQDAAALEELKAEGQLIQGESFEFYIPADWTDVELNDEQAAEGYVYAACSADEAQGLVVVWKELDAAQTAAAWTRATICSSLRRLPMRLSCRSRTRLHLL